VEERHHQLVCDPVAALEKAGELERFIEKHSADLREGRVKAADSLLSRIGRTFLQPGQKRDLLEDMLGSSA